MIHTYCPLDGTDSHDDELFPANFDAAAIDATHFSARRVPDRIHYRMVRNRETGCIRADPVFPADTLRQLYNDSRVTYENLAEYTTATYLDSLERTLGALPSREGIARNRGRSRMVPRRRSRDGLRPRRRRRTER